MLTASRLTAYAPARSFVKSTIDAGDLPPRRYRSFAPQPVAFLMPETGGEVVIDHAHRLGEGIDDDGTAKAEAALFQFFRQTLTHLGLCRYLVAGLEAVEAGLAVDMLPDQTAKTAGLFFLDLQPELCAFDGGLDLGAAADDAVILEQPVDVT